MPPCGPRGPVGEVQQPLELLRFGGVAAQVVADLAGSVVVAGAGDHQVEPGGELPQPGPGRRVVVLVVDLYPGQPDLAQPGQATLVEGAVVVPGGPGVREHGDPAGLADAPDHGLQVCGVAAHVSGALGAEVPLEGLVSVGHHAEGHERVRDVWPSHRRGLPGDGADVVHVDPDADVPQP